jgi:membrane protein implicated in regulation of membrane protease activity
VSFDQARYTCMVLALLGVFLVSMGLVAGWRHFIAWKWVTVAFLGFQVVLAFSYVDAALDPTQPDGPAPLRLWLQMVALVLIVVAALYAVVTDRRDPNRPRGPVRR